MRKFCIVLITVMIVATASWGPRSMSVSASNHGDAAAAKKTCKVVKKNGHKKKVCHTARVAPTPTPSPTPTEVPGPYYLALGDSLTSGYTPDGGTEPHGMANQFFAILQSHGVNSLLNLACAGESSSSFISGPCPVPEQVAGHYGTYPSSSSQLVAALAFIHDHPGQVKYVTIDIGNNDIASPDVSGGGCDYTGAGFPEQIARFDANFRSILAQLKAAVGSSGVILAINRYDAYATFCAKVPAALAIFPTYNTHLAADAAVYGVPVADIYTAFGGPAAPNSKLCTLTYMCQASPDHHATPAGHALIANVLKATAGL